MDWTGTCFVANPANTPLDSPPLPPGVKRLAVQVAWSLHPQAIDPVWLERARERFDVLAWAWCQGTDVELEAERHGALAAGYSAFVANMEAPYDAGGNQADDRFHWPTYYLDALEWDGPLGLTVTPTFGSDMTAWRERGAIYMPQAFPLENGYDVTGCVEHGEAWGWPPEQQRPLAQCYTTEMMSSRGRVIRRHTQPRTAERPSGAQLNADASAHAVGLIPYVVEQAIDSGGQAWFAECAPSIARPTVYTPDEGGDTDMATHYIGPQHGAKAVWERMRALDPDGSHPDFDPDHPDAIPLDQLKAYDKECRAKLIVYADHDEALG